MFQFLGKVVSRGWPVLLVFWVLAFAGVYVAAPKWADVAVDREFELMPNDMPSRRGEELFKQAFPDDLLASSVVIVLSRDDEAGLTEEDQQFIEIVLTPRLLEIADEEGGLAAEPAPAGPPQTDEPVAPPNARPTNDAEKSIIARIHSMSEPGIGSLLVSADKKASLVVVELTTEFLEHRNWDTVEKIENLIAEFRDQQEIPSGLQVALTGNAVVGRDTTLAQVESAENTEFWTVLLVIGLLIVIYRAPLVALIPLITVFFAVEISIKLLSLLAKAEIIALFEGIQIFITVLVYGAGVDYCLFLIARYKEELDSGAGVREAVAGAIGKVGTALVASAATVIGGIGMMTFAEFGKFHQAGIAIPIGIAVVLLAALTLSSSLLVLTGRWAFWPFMTHPVPAGGSPEVAESAARPPRQIPFGRMWERVGQILLHRPGWTWFASVVAMAPFAVIAVRQYNNLNFDLLNKLSQDAPSVVGTRALERYFPAGATGPLTVLIRNDEVDFTEPANGELIGQLTEQLGARSDELEIADIRSLSQPLGMRESEPEATTRTEAPSDTATTPEAAPGQSAGGLPVSPAQIQQVVRQRALAHYVASGDALAGHVTRLELTFDDNPFSRRSTERLGEIEWEVRANLPNELRYSQIQLIGATASIRDLETVTNRDQARIEILVLATVFVILMLLLRSVVISIYLILSVLLSFLATMGVTFGLFWMLDPSGFEGLDWKVPIFLFTILIAVGEDYNIFLMTRIREEQRREGPVRGITAALAKTGGIISSCGVIMAGTFSSLLSGTLAGMLQLGFALAFGVLLDTFVVRPILVPAFLILLENARSRFKGWRLREQAAPTGGQSKPV